MGKRANDGDERVAPNGYRYRRVSGKWVLVHHIVAVKKLGRQLLPSEGAYFVDGDRTNFSPDNVGIRVKGGGKQRARLAAIEERIRELEAEREIILKDLGEQA